MTDCRYKNNNNIKMVGIYSTLRILTKHNIYTYIVELVMNYILLYRKYKIYNGRRYID